VANEVDAARSRRLAGVLAEYLPLDLLSGGEEACVRVLNKPADTYFKRQDEESYDRVLLDAPCSSDRHILQQAAGTARTGATGAVAEWSVAGCKRIAALQLQLLLAGLRALSPGGKLVYRWVGIIMSGSGPRNELL
jgi:16S rRNA C967 or C1407 C5-methylase (RsmB/RsmF family)